MSQLFFRSSGACSFPTFDPRLTRLRKNSGGVVVLKGHGFQPCPFKTCTPIYEFFRSLLGQQYSGVVQFEAALPSTQVISPGSFQPL